MTPNEERLLCRNDYGAWCKHVAPRLNERYAAASPAERERIYKVTSPALRAAMRDAGPRAKPKLRIVRDTTQGDLL